MRASILRSQLLLGCFIMLGLSVFSVHAQKPSRAQTPAAAAGPTAILSWTDYPPALAYDGVIVQRKPTGGTYAEIGRVAKGVTSYTDTTITSGQTYCWVVVGYAGTMVAPPSNENCGGNLPALQNLILRFQ